MTSMSTHSIHLLTRNQAGLTLIELMIAMVLGMVVIGGVISVFIANGQAYRTNEAISQLQDGARTGFELLARDIRQSAGTGCGNTESINNILTAGSNWWQNWLGIRVYAGDVASPAVDFGTDEGERITGTDALLLQGVEGAALSVQTHSASSPPSTVGSFRINPATTAVVANDILMACHLENAAIFQATDITAVTTPPATDVSYMGIASAGIFGPNTQIARFAAVTWFVGHNGRASDGGRSLYRVRLGAGATVVIEEILSGVTDMQLRFRETDADAFAETPVNWDDVNAVEVVLTMDSTDRNVSVNPSDNEGRLRRSFTTIVGLRNRSE